MGLARSCARILGHGAQVTFPHRTDDRHAKLLTTFDTGKTNSVKLVVGETSGGTNFVNVTELAVNSTPRYWRSGGTADTNNVVTADNYYTAATNVYVSLTPTGSALSDNTRGKVRVYFQLR